jgi:ABC-type antimicrobial peptide transport system permease subunit
MKVARALIGMNFREDTVQKNVTLIVGYMAYIFSITVTSNLVLSVLAASFNVTGRFELLLSVSVIFTTTLIATSIAIKLGLFGQRKRQ